MTSGPVAYLDAASTEPLHPAARDVLLAAVDEGWADPARLYGAARRAQLMLDNAREMVASALGARPDEVFFTTSGTQAIHLGLLGALAGRRRTGSDLVFSAVEHASVLHTADLHAGAGGARHAVPVDRAGRVDPAEFGARLSDQTAVACLQAANHEVGTLQPVAEVAEECVRLGVPLLVDAAQAVGRVLLPRGWSLLTASAHKWGGPAGVGVLVVRKGVRFRSPLPRDEREHGRVPGFENVPAILAATAALQARLAERAELTARHSAWIERIRTELPRRVSDVEVVGHPTERLPHLVTFSCLYVEGEALLLELDRAGFAVSSGSSCTSSTVRPSHVLEAMGVLSHGNIRVSLSRDTTEEQVERFLAVVPDVVARLRAQAGVESL